MSLALREIRGHLAQPVVLAALVATVAVLAISGPFRTLDMLGPAQRLIYWALVVFGSYGLGTALGVILAAPLDRLGIWQGRLMSLPVYGIVIGGYLVAMQGLAFAAWPQGPADMLSEFGMATLVSALLLGVDALATPRPGPAAMPAPPAGPPRPALLERLAPGQRGALIALSAEDHYVRVRTAAGQALVLLRLSDAIRETAPEPGLRIHRSHWVAARAVRAVRRAGDGAMLDLTDGTSLPVSRRYMADLRQAGLLPERGRAT